jgi:hypothetical protein
LISHLSIWGDHKRTNKAKAKKKSGFLSFSQEEFEHVQRSLSKRIG